jgi:hypothetical protein
MRALVGHRPLRVTYPNGDQAFVVGMTFLAGQVGGDAVADGDEGLELGWYAPDELPAMSGYNGVPARRALANLGTWGDAQNG